MNHDNLKNKRCEPCEGIGAPLNKEQIGNLLPQLTTDWTVNENHTAIKRVLHFSNFHDTMAFVNALAWIAHNENHHPDMEVGYNQCTVHYTTHALKGLSQNDFICAAKLDKLFLN